ncbi:MAG: LamB/YcsF family protein [Chloroflexota bacterium]|nr:LamB/YcsF family protein [Chloroflexota bacterium]
MTTIDLNADMGESYGIWCLGADEELMPLVSSASLACGYHAGDPSTIQTSVRLALRHGVALGAHPSYPDLQGFGRRSMRVPPSELQALLVYQVAAVEGIVRASGGQLRHVKLHGALYNAAARDLELAQATVDAIRSLNPELLLYALAGSELARSGRSAGLGVVEEAFADRRYNADGSLQSRHIEGSLLTDPEAAAAQAVRIATTGTVMASDGSELPVRAGTICIHGDNPSAVRIARAVRQALAEAGVQVQAPWQG